MVERCVVRGELEVFRAGIGRENKRILARPGEEACGVVAGDRRYSAGRLQLSWNRRIIDDGSSAAVASEFEVRQNVGAVEVQGGGVCSIDDRQNSVGIAVVDRIEIDTFKIDLIRS